MKRFSLSLTQKLWLTGSIVVIVTIAFSFGLMNYIYEDVYIRDVENKLKDEGLRLAKQYEGGPVSQTYIEQVDWYNKISESEIILVDNPRELSACLPFDVQYDSLVSENERRDLLDGKLVVKSGYEKRFNRQIIGVMVPLLDESRLQGVIYLYLTVASIQEVFEQPRLIVVVAGMLFILMTIMVGRQIIKRLTKPLEQMEKIAEKLGQGDFRERVSVNTGDEVGRLGVAFNKMADALSDIEQNRKDFLANVSHELRTPISYVKGYSEACLDGVIKTDSEKRKYMELIHREAGRMQRLVRDLLDLAQMEGESYPLHKVPLSLAQLIEETMEKYGPFLKEKGITFSMDLDPGIIVEADQDRLEQVIQNVMDNAIRYTPQQGNITVKLVEEKDHYCKITISDSGPGISKEHLERLGERFYRVDKARSRQYGGTGLGLAIVRQILNLHGGRLEIDSEVGKGTDMNIFLPALIDEEQ